MNINQPQKIKKYDRSRQILLVLKDHGPISSRVLQQLIKPTIQPRKLRYALARLTEKGLIVRRQERFTGSDLNYYQLNQSLVYRQDVACLLHCHPDELEQGHFRYREFMHNDGLALVAEHVRSLYPKANILRDFQMDRFPDAEFILGQTKDHELKPDFLLHIPKSTTTHELWIAFEYELTRKSDRRLIRKLRRYAAATKIDGVVYICREHRIEDAIRANYQRYVSSWARRVMPYTNNFVLLQNADTLADCRIENLFRLDRSMLSLRKWITILQNTNHHDRLDKYFDIGAARGPFLNQSPQSTEV